MHISVSINIVLLEQRYTHSFAYFCAMTVGQSGQDRDCLACKDKKIYSLTQYRKSSHPTR